MARGWYASDHQECVPFVRDRSDIKLYGNAHSWWDQIPKNQRSHTPAPGAIMVLSDSHKLHYGHLALVTQLINNREIEVTHTNWGSNSSTRRRVYEMMRVRDSSTDNDWSEATFWNKDAGSFGFPYPVDGFIHPQPIASVPEQIEVPLVPSVLDLWRDNQPSDATLGSHDGTAPMPLQSAP